MSKPLLDHMLQGDFDTEAWETFHEASKTSRYQVPPSSEEIRKRMKRMATSFAYDGYATHALPPPPPLLMALSDAMLRRATGRDIAPVALSDQALAAILHYGVGETRDETAAGYPRPFRITPSGGAMYPLEIYVHTSRAEGLRAGIYHYHPGRHELALTIQGDQTRKLSAALVQQKLPLEVSALIFITGVFERSNFKYGERGYRFALLEAGHVAQNMLLAAGSMDLAAVPIGGFFDRDIDELLRIDGLSQSTLYMLAIGGHSGQAWLGL